MIYTAGNAGNGSNPQPDGVILGAGAQLIDPLKEAESSQTPGTPTPVASFSVTELGDKADKIGKDDNFRGMTIFNNVLYYTKGSGSNGVNTVYFVDTTGTACPNGIGLPAAGAKLPTAPLTYNPATLQTTGLPNNMCILAGFPAVPAKTATHRRISLRHLVRQREYDSMWRMKVTAIPAAPISTHMPLRKPQPVCRSGSSTAQRKRGAWRTRCKLA